MLLAAAYLNRAFSLGDFDVSDDACVYSWVALLLAQYLYYVFGVCADLSRELGISVFTI